MPSRVLDWLSARRTRQVIMWLALAGAVGHRGVQAWINFRVEERPDKNDGHTSIDYGGQWMMGRMLILGHGRELYSRARHLEVARASYPRNREAPGATDHDAERLVRWYIGDDSDPVGGPLYPPVHAFVMAPLAMISDPYLSYREAQGLMIVLIFVAGAGVRYLTRGRWWWSSATFLLLMFPGCRGAIDLAQNSPLTIAILIWAWALLVRGRPGWGGVLLGLLAFKPVWAVSFLAALLLLRQWRAAFAMAATGAGLALLTIPVVGLQSWLDWLHIGKLASDAYAVDRNWIFLSRDLFGIPRRMFQEYRDGIAVRDEAIAAIVGWALWAVVAGVTLLVTYVAMRRRPVGWVEALRNPPAGDGGFRKASTHPTKPPAGDEPLTGPLPAFVLFAAWLCTYRFMYYDALVAAIGVVVLMADPRPFFRKSWWPFASWAAVLVALLLIVENVTAPLNVEMSASVMGFRKTLTNEAGRVTAPTVYIASGDEYPWDTVVVIALWVWCLVRVMRSGEPGQGNGEPAAVHASVEASARRG